MKQELALALNTALEQAGIAGLDQAAVLASLAYPENMDHGDYSTAIALAHAKKLSMSPRALAEKIAAEFEKVRMADQRLDFIESVSIAGPGFINFKIKDRALAEAAVRAGKASDPKRFPQGKRQVMVEYTDPNTFKPFHIGHLMANAIGESLSRLVERAGSSVVRICYPADIGLHIAKSVWALDKHLSDMPADSAPITERTAFLGKMYVEGTAAYDADPAAKAEIDRLNKVLYEKSDPAVNALYEKGRTWSLDHFELLYKLLGTTFDGYIFESEMAPVGLAIVKEFMAKGVFEESEGAIVFKGDKYGSHTRVFINSHGLPTYEAKEMGLNVTKFKRYPDLAQSIIVTANEQNEYFKVVLKALSLIDPAIGAKSMHIGHGLMRFQSGKMSSRTGNVVTAEALIDDIKALVTEKMAGRDLDPAEADEIADIVAIGAIKYSILRQGIGGDVIFDSAKSISFEGDSGPYLQYAAVRAQSVLEKAEVQEAGSKKQEAGDIAMPDHVGLLERLIIRFPDIADRARQEYAPQLVATYLIELAGAFNAFYAGNVIVDPKEPLSPYRIELTKAFLKTMTDGLWLLGIKVPRKM